MRFESVGRYGVAVGGAHTFGVDAFLLAHFCAGACGDAVCDLGTGCGIIPMILADRTDAATIVGVDVQQKAVDLFRAAIARYALGERVQPVCADWHDLSMLPEGGFSAVTANPPYFKTGCGKPSPDEARRLAREGDDDCFPSLCRAAAALLRADGRLFLCLPPGRLDDMRAALSAAELHLIAIRPVISRGETVKLLLLSAAKQPGKTAELLPWRLTDSNFLNELYNL